MKIKESKITSTEATRSFQAENEHSDPMTSYCFKETTFDFSSIRALEQKPVQEKAVTSKALKKTMAISKYDFGGIIEP